MNRTIKQINKKIISLFLVVIVLFSVIPTVLFSAFAEEIDKTKFIMPIESFDASAVRINTPEDLIAIANNMYGSYVLANDIDMSGYSWTPIGKSLSSPFYGKLDGQGHKIINLNINISINSASLNSPAHAVGLFGVCSGAVIKNIDFENASVSVSNSSGYEYTNVKIEGRNIYAGVYVDMQKMQRLFIIVAFPVMLALHRRGKLKMHFQVLLSVLLNLQLFQQHIVIVRQNHQHKIKCTIVLLLQAVLSVR